MENSNLLTNNMVERIQAVWAHVLNLPHVALDQPFLAVGGDSISAMQVVSQCLRVGIGLGVPDVLRCRSIVQLSGAVREIEQTSYDSVEYFDEDFDLSPIQSLYFQRPNQGRGHFNQSFYLQVKQKTSSDEFCAAIEQLISRHSMLRARFSSSDGYGWQQRLTNDIHGSYRFRYQQVASKGEIDSMIEDSQQCLDHEHGPLFAADFFDFGPDQFAFLTAHHIVIDLVSWRLLLEELEEILRGGTLLPPALPFQKWAELQIEHAETLKLDEVLPPVNVPSLDFDYWGIQREDNTYGNASQALFELDTEITSMFLTNCHRAYNTEPVELLLASLIQSWARIFTDRPIPAIFNEGHGREPWSELDISRTVGWFTALSPILVTPSKDSTETVRKVKDFKRQIIGNGRPYFARRCLTEEGREHYKTHWPMEILFNYLGQYQQLERADALLQPLDTMAGEYRAAGGTSDFGHITPRWGLFEISAIVFKGHLKFAFTFNRHMRHQNLISTWISECRTTLEEMIKGLSAKEPMPTLSDFPLLSLTEERFRSMLVSLAKIGVSPSAIEDAYPCSNMQEGLLLSQSKDAGFYAATSFHELRSCDGQLSPELVAIAWRQVVQRHPLLRTVFLENFGRRDGLYSQVVLKEIDAQIVHFECKDNYEAMQFFQSQRSVSYASGPCPNHRLTICTTADKRIFCSLDISHAIMDGHSMSLLASELKQACEGRLSGSGAPYSDYISWLIRQPQESSIEFWKSYLGGSEITSFPILDDGQKVEKQLVSIRIDMTALSMPDLHNFCNVNGITLSNIFHTAWALTLGCYAGSTDVTFGYLTSARDCQEIHRTEDIVGPMINTLVCRVNLSDNSRCLLDVVQDVQRDYLEALPHRHVALADVQHVLGLSGANLFNTALSYRRLPSESVKEDEAVEIIEVAPIYDPTEYPVSINIEIGDSSTAVDLDYWTDHLSAGQAANVASTFTRALENIIYNSSHRISTLDHLSPNHWRQIQAWNVMPPTMNDCVHHKFSSWVAAQPAAPAICSFDGDYTYAQLEAVTDRLAHHLVKLGVGPELYVPTCFDKSSFAIVAMLSVLKAGGAAVPLDAQHPKVALKTRLEDAGATIVLTTAVRAEKFEGLVPNVIIVDMDFLDRLPTLSGQPCTSVQPHNPCFVIFTSGSTGRPKGVVLEHSAMVTSAEAHGSKLSLGPGLRVLQFASYTFDNSLEEMFTSLQRGACVCVPSEEQRMNDLPGAIAKLNANFVDLTPTVAALLKPSEVPSLKSMCLGAEPLTKALIELWRPHVRLFGQYGPSEASINSAWRDFTNGGEATNIGKAIGSVSYVINPDNRDRLMPIGCKGELLIEGPILSRGYLNDPQKTALAFIEDPEWARIGGSTKRRFYCTGDLVQYTSEGEMIYMGRKDSQVKLNGQRIELGEIEHHLKLNLPSAAKSAVELVKFTDSNATKSLVGFICLDADSTSAPSICEMTDAVRAMAKEVEVALGNSLPTYYVPAMFMPVSSMPMTTSGKLDRKVLRQLAAAIPESQMAAFRLAGNSGRAPSGFVEVTLAQLWATVLKLSVDTVGAEDSFFRLGGDSISAMRLVTTSRKEGIMLSVANVFAQPKLADMAATAIVLSAEERTSDFEADTKPFELIPEAKKQQIIDFAAAECAVAVEDIEDIYPCSRLQEGLIALSAKDPGTYVAQPTYRLPSDINISRFRKAWHRVIENEAVLRTRIIHSDEFGFVQVVVKAIPEWESLETLDEVKEIHRMLPARPGGPLISYIIVGEGTDSPFFVWTAHHAVYDGWSWSTLFNQVESCYHDDGWNIPASIPFSRFVRYLSTLNPADSDRFWLSHLDNITAPQFPRLPNPDYQVQATCQFMHEMKLNRNMDLGVTKPSLIRAAWGLLLATYSGSNDVIWGETNSGREAPVLGIEDIIGPTLTTAPVRLKLDQQLSVRHYLSEIQRQASTTLPHQFAGLQHIRKLSAETAMACDFQCFLGLVAGDNLQDVETDLWSMQSTGTFGTNFFSYALVCNCTVEEDSLDIEVLYDPHVTEKWYIQRLVQQFEYIIQCFTSSDSLDAPLCDLDLVSPADLGTILTWNKTPVPTLSQCIHSAIAEGPGSTNPTATAIDAWDMGKVSYRELDDRATRLACVLVSLGIKSQSFVPICFDKSGWAIVAILAVLKAGAAFVPLDFEAPILRLQEISRDVNAEFILCASGFEDRCRLIGCKVLVVDQNTMDNHQSISSLPQVKSDAPAYAFYTSGSTGKPKGALINHSSWVSCANVSAPVWGMSASTRVLQFASYTFDACLVEIFSTLMYGGTVCVPDQASRTNDLAGIIKKFNVNCAVLTPTVVRMMQPSEVPTLETLILVGEAMSQQDLLTWSERLTLFNGYGPTECTAVSNTIIMSLRTKPNNIGKAITSRGWVVSRDSHNILVPIGAVGELILEGPAVGAGYLNDPERTAQSFISNVRWASLNADLKTARFYKTGDLVKYNEDGTMLYLGRKDLQTKVRGQRLELAEVEHHLMEDHLVQSALASVPSSGPCAKRLVGVVSLKDPALSGTSVQAMELVAKEVASLNVGSVRDRLCEHLPSYMVPSLWVTIGRFPVTAGGKMDRRRIVQWLESMDAETYREISTLGQETSTTEASDTELKLQTIFSKILNLQVEDVRLNQSFLHLGGDSIAAMQVSSQCRAAGLPISVQQLIRAKSITELAANVTASDASIPSTAEAEEFNSAFELSPVQRLFFEVVGEEHNYFNQAELFNLSRTFELEDINASLSTLVSIHPMLRARFTRDSFGKWQQHIEKDSKMSFRLREHSVPTCNNDTLRPIIDNSQATLNISSGPVFSIDVFNVQDTFSQAISIIAHHLVVDVVSWGIILDDFQELLTGTNPPPQSLPFHAWLKQQSIQAKKDAASKVFPVPSISAANFDYWGMDQQRNIHGDVVEQELSLTTRDTMLLLGAQDALGTETIDILVAALLESFRRTFPDRPAIAVHNEGHGREPFDNKQDLTRTVGWFSTLTPIDLPVSIADPTDLVSTIRWVNDVRERTPGKGRPYFALRQLSEDGQSRFSSHWPAEVIFNYHGRMQHLDRKGALFQPLDGIDTSEVGNNVPRLALFDVTAAINQGAIKMSFGYNRHMKRQAEIRAWISDCRQTLIDAVDELLQVRPERNLSDFKLLPLTYNGMSRLSGSLPLGATIADVEDIYPTSPMQQGLLLTQLKYPELYMYHAILEVQLAKPDQMVDPRRLAEAWQVVVNRHPALRTFFIDSIAKNGSKDQVVWKTKAGRTQFITESDEKVAETLRNQPGIDCREPLPPHCLTICKTTTGKVWLKLELSHAINDGTSITNLLSDLSLAYERKLTRADKGPLYRDFIAHIYTNSPEADVAYWKNYLSGIEPCFFPTLNDGKSGPHLHKSVEVNIHDTTAIYSFCKKHGVTLSNVLQLSWALVLHCFVGASDVSFGVVASGRDVPVKNIEEAVGVFVNMLVARLSFSDDTTIAKLLAQLQTDSVNALSHQNFSLADIQNELQLASLFNSVFTFQRRSLSRDPEQTALVYENMEAEDPGEYAITINADVDEENISVDFGYWEDKVCSAQAHSFAQTFEKILLSIISGDANNQTVGHLDTLTSQSLRQILDWNANLPAPIRRCVHEVIHEQAVLRPRTAKAVEGHDGTFTYQEFDKITDQLAVHLQSNGVTTETFVPILFDKSSWAIVSMIAIMKAGGAYVPLDPKHPQSRLEELITDVGAKVVLCSRTHHARASKVASMALVVDAQAFRKLRMPSTAKPKPSATPDNASYCLFTSGTTGKPKGTIIPHQAFSTSAAAFTRRMNINATSRTFQFASYTFDASCIEILSALTVGATVCVPSEDERMNNPAGAIRKYKATWSLLTPSVLGTIEPDHVSCLQTIVSGGEALPGPIMKKWGTSICFINAYGPTECAVVAATCYKSTLDRKLLETEPGTIGTGSGARLWIVHPRNHDKLMPLGSVGELVVEGPTVARGYLNDEVKTAKAFIENPAWVSLLSSNGSIDTTARMYKTGDLVRYNSDGSVSYIGRKDTQIKLNGQRIELGEIEFHVSKNFPEHVQSAVELVAPSSRASAKALAVFFAVAQNQPTEKVESVQPTSTDLPAADELLLSMSDELRELCKSAENGLAGALPSYMIPNIFIPVSKMPWTSAGKLDRNRLRTLVQNLSREAMAPYRLTSMMNKKQPSSETEKKLHKIVCTVLNLPASAVGIDDSFIRLGGNSVLAMRLVAAAQSERMDLSVIDIFTQPRLSDLAAKCSTSDATNINKQPIKPFELLQLPLERNQVIEEVAQHCRVPKDQVQDALPASPLQEALFTLTVKQRGAYVAQHILELAASVKMDKLKLAWDQAVQEFDILRTRMVQLQSGKFVQVVVNEAPIAWHEATSLQEIEEDATRIPEYIGGELTTYTIVQTSANKRYFVLTIHHSLYDGWSIALLLQYVQQVYRTGKSDISRTSYSQFIKYLSTVDTKACQQFWTSSLTGASSFRFPAQSHSMLAEQPRGQMLQHSLEFAAQRYNDVTPANFIRAAWALLLATHTSSDNVVFGETLTGRDISVKGITDICGPVLTTVPTRVQIDRSATVVDFLRKLSVDVTTRIPHQHFGLSEIKRLGEDMSAACDFQNLLVVQTADEDIAESMWSVHDGDAQGNFFTYPLVLECTLESSRIEILAHFHENVISEFKVQRLLFEFGSILTQLNTASKIGDIRVFCEQDKDQVSKWNSLDPVTVDETIPSLFFKQVEMQPHAIAVSAFDGELTYAELHDLANSLGQSLVKLGAGPGTLIPTCLDKSRLAIVAIMAILISGAGYVPISPDHPSARHEQVFKDCKASIVLCSREYQGKFSTLVQNVVEVDEASVQRLPSSDHNMPLRAKGSDICYVIYTSGSTGVPKGVVFDHRAIASSSAAICEGLHMTSTSRVFQFCSLLFDVSIGEILTPLTCGATVCVPSEQQRTTDVAAAITSLRADWAFLTPSVACLIDGPSAVPTLKSLVIGGEAMTSEVIDKFADGLGLYNGYGPTGGSIFAVTNDQVSTQKNPSIIGHVLRSGRSWLTNPTNPHQLAPIGSVAELCLEGSLLAKGYLNDQEKTAESFIENPAFLKDFASNTTSRIYRTGDLVQYEPNGSLLYLGRRDSQVELAGQRIELSEIENHLQEDEGIVHAVVQLPKSGPGKDRLIATVSFAGEPRNASTAWTKVLTTPETGPRLSRARERLSDLLPSYMIPSVWVAVPHIPLLPSAKVDRGQVGSWLEGMDNGIFQSILELDSSDTSIVPKTKAMSLLQTIWAKVLDVPVDGVQANRSWLSLGGDSITAMQLLAKCRAEGIQLTLNQVLRAKSLAHLARSIEPSTVLDYGTAQFDTPFDLSPIQQLYFQTNGNENGSHFNQSFTMRVSRAISSDALQSAFDTIVKCHPMLRARFIKGENGEWRQTIPGSSAESYKFKTHRVAKVADAANIVAASQKSLDIQAGPVFVVNAINLNAGEQILSIVAHHLVVDVVSWQIIVGDLEDILTATTTHVPQQELPFQTWIEQQAAHACQKSQQYTMTKQNFNVHPTDLTFWGMDKRSNVYGDVERDGFCMESRISAMALNEHSKLRTDVVDLLLASIIHSFSRVFINRMPPTIFNESHGREAWESSNLDLSRTVGWFTTVYPVTVPIAEDEDELIHTVRQVKDLRRSIVDNGRPYFAHRFLTEDGRSRFGNHEPMEVIFNFLGKTQQQDSKGSLFQSVDFDEDDDEMTSDVGSKTARMALFEISASINNGQIEMSFMYNRWMKNRKGIRRWITECEQTLEEIVTTLSELKAPQPTMADFPLLPLESYNRLDRVLKTMPLVGIASYDLIEDIYPCSAIQEGMLLSQIKEPDSYWSHVIFEVKNKWGTVDTSKVAEAWKTVVGRHQALRTVIVDSVCKGGVFDQIVMRQPETGLVFFTCSDAELNYRLESIRYRDLNGQKKTRLPHQAAIVQTKSGRIVVKVIVNHAVIDGGSLAILGRDLQEAYTSGSVTEDAPLYSDYIKYLQGLDAKAATDYWKGRLRGVLPCYFPSIPQHTAKHRKLRTLDLTFRRFSDLHALAEGHNVTLANILLATWSLILRSYTNSTDVCYGYLTSGRNVPIDNIENAVGAFINMLVSRAKIAPTDSLMDLVQNVQNDFIESIPHQHCSLAQFQHDLGLSGKALFNTAISVQNIGAAQTVDESDTDIDFEQLDGHDPSEFAITVNIDATRGDEGVRFAYWTDAVSDEEARKVSGMMATILTQLLANPTQSVADLDTVITEQPTFPRSTNIPTTNYFSPRSRPRPASWRSNSSLHTPNLAAPAPSPSGSAEAPDWSNLIRSIVSEMVPQIVDQMMARNTQVPQPGPSTINQMANQMTGMIARRTSISQTGRPNFETSSLRSRRVSMTSNAESRIQTAADMVAAAGVMVSEASQAPEMVEKKLLGLWSELLDMVEDTIEKDDSFFQLGGDSIIAMRLVGAAREEGLSITVADVFKNPTFADMARVVRVAGEVIDEVISRAGGGSAVDDRLGQSSVGNRLPARAAMLWNDFQSVISEYKGDGNSVLGSIPPGDAEQQARRDSYKKWSGMTPTHAPPGALAARRNSSRSQTVPRIIEEGIESVGTKSVSLLGDPNVDSVIAKVQVFKGGISDVLPVTDFQALAITGSLLESKWMLNYFFFEGNGPLDLRKLKQSAFRIVQAFDILRTVFVPYGDRFLQVVLRKLQPDFIYQQTDDDFETFTTELRKRDRANGPRLGEPFTQFVVVKQKQSGRYRVFMRLSHAQYDGVCIGKILEALQAGYNGLPVSTAPSFGNFVRESAKAVAGAHDHWRETLRGSKMTEIVNHFGPNYQRSAGRTVTLEDKITTRMLSHINITTATIVKAAWAATLARIAGKSDIIFGLVISGRNSTMKNIENIVGPCLNTVPVRVVYRPEWTVLDLLGYIQDQQIANMPYESLGFRDITRHCTDWPDWTNFSSVLQHDQNIQSEKATLQLGGVEYLLGAAGHQEDFADFSINTTAHSSNQLEVALTYAPNSTITTEYAQQVFDLLCANIISFTKDPNALLPSPSELSSQSSSTNNSEKVLKKSDQKSAVSLPTDSTLSKSEISALATTLRAAWQQIVHGEHGSPIDIELSSDFFQLGGDIMGLAQVSSILAEDGFTIRVEELLDKSVFVDQISLLVQERKKQREQDLQNEKSPWGEKGKLKKAETAKTESKKGGFGALARKMGLKKSNTRA